jgi:hypothetical protein
MSVYLLYNKTNIKLNWVKTLDARNKEKHKLKRSFDDSNLKNIAHVFRF